MTEQAREGDHLGAENALAEKTGTENRWLVLRRRIAGNTALNLTYRIAVGVIGTAVLVAGIIAIPYPGPGWLIVFAGLGILGSEFAWAYRLLGFARGKYDDFMEWFAQQSLVVKLASGLLTVVVVVGTLWLLGTFGLIGGWFGFEHPLLESPL